MQSYPTNSPTISSQLMSNHSYEITHYRDKDLKAVSLHSHDFYELYYFISGNASYIIENLHYKLMPGDVLLISPQNLHRLDINDSSVSYERIVLWLNPRFVRRLSSAKTDLSFCFSATAADKNFLLRDYRFSETLRSMLMSLTQLQDSSAYGDDVAAENLIRSILLQLCRYFASPHATVSDSKRSNPTVSELLSYVDANLSAELTLDALAERLFVSKYYLERLFKAETNSTLHQYILKKRLLMSKTYIEQGLHVTEIYPKCGFTDYSHFFRAFKQEYGITPKQYYALVTRQP